MANWFLNLSWFGVGSEGGDPEARELGSPAATPLAGFEEEEVAALELVVASSAMLLILGATDLVLDWRREGTLNGG